MRTQKYVLAGGDVPAHLKGTVIQIRVPETIAEQTQLAGGNEALGVAKFADGYVIVAQGKLRRASAAVDKDGKHTATPEALQKIADELTLVERAEGTPRQTKPETKARNAAADNAEKNFIRALTDAKFLKQGVQFGFIDEDAFNVWKSNREAAEAAKAAPATEPAK